MKLHFISMRRHKSPYLLIQRPNGYWYFKIEGWTNYKTTGSRKESDAKRAVALTLREQKQETRTGLTFDQYAAPFYVWETCPYRPHERKKGSRTRRGYDGLAKHLPCDFDGGASRTRPGIVADVWRQIVRFDGGIAS